MGIDFIKLMSFIAITFMLIEVIKISLQRLKSNVIRIISFIILTLFSALLADIAPVYGKAWGINFFIYLISEYFVFLIVKNEMKISIKDIIIKKLGIVKEK